MPEIIEINSGLQSVLLLDRITAVGAGDIRGTTNFSGTAVFTLIEAMAQLGAFHVRFCDGFQRHAFLLKVVKCILPNPLPEAGYLDLRGELTAHSDRSYSYRIRGGRQGKTLIEGDFWYSTVDYDWRFEGEMLQEHYRKVFSCLTSASGTG
ncbi:MAG: hypothetical protein JW902_15165 [Syntrophaceae bacterium]|nr:hypothetical protein [Syntrophaceae bacterium]